MSSKASSTPGQKGGSGKKRFFWDEKDALFEQFLAEIYNASVKGYSVIEMQRCLALATARPLYVLMRKHKFIPKLPVGRSPRNLEIHPALEKGLSRCDISFVQWANSHELDAAATAEALVTAVDPTNPVSVAAHKAMSQDFAILAASLYGLPAPPSRAGEDHRRSSGYTITIEYLEDSQDYHAYTHGLPDCEATGPTMDAAYFALKNRYVLYHSIRKLRLLPSREQAL